MSIVLINPNSTVSMTDSALAAARAAAPGLSFEGWTNAGAPPAIQGPEDGAAAVPPLLDLVGKAEVAEGIIIACADDTGLAEARAMAPCPVLGIGQAAYTAATLLSDRFAVVTTLAVSVPVLEANIVAGGFGPASTGVFASGVPVLALEDIDDANFARLCDALRAADRSGAGTIVLGCSGMAPLVPRLRQATGLRMIDGVSAAARLMQALTGL